MSGRVVAVFVLATLALSALAQVGSSTAVPATHSHDVGVSTPRLLTPLRAFLTYKLDAFDGDGQISALDVVQFLLQMDPLGDRLREPAAAERTTAAAHAVIKSMDTNSDGTVSWEEFSAKYGALDISLTDTTPSEVHIALTDDASQLLVQWVSTSNCSSLATPAAVAYGLSPDSLTTVVPAAPPSTYSVDGGIWTSFFQYTALLTGLQPRTRYYYRCGCDGAGYSSIFNVTSAPAPPSSASGRRRQPQDDSVLSWAIYGDMGTVVPFGAAVTQELLAEHALSPFDIVLHVGDIAYAGLDKHGEWEPTWDVYMNQIQPLASIVPYQTVVGNHESFFNFSAFINRFQMPGDPHPSPPPSSMLSAPAPQPKTVRKGGYGNFWFSFDFGDVHVAAMSTEHAYDFDSEQYAWLEQDLAAAAGNPNINWIFLAGHRPYYSSDKEEYDSHKPGARLLHYLEPLIVKYRVDMILTGHMHCYERTWPTINGTVYNATASQQGDVTIFTKPTAPIYIVQGTAGAWIWENWVDPVPDWSAARAQSYGYGHMWTYSAASSHGVSLHYQYKSGEQVLDDFWIYK